MPDLSPMGILAKAWNQPPVDDGELEMTVLLLADVPGEELARVMLDLARTYGPWRPTASIIRNAVVESRGLFPTPADAHLTARKYIEVRDWYRANGAASVFPLVHPIACAAADAAGTELEGSFNRAYRDAVTAATKEIQKGRLDEPVIYRPARVCRDHTPPDLTWHSGGWWNPAGELVADGRGNKIRLSGPTRPELTRGLTEETT